MLLINPRITNRSCKKIHLSLKPSLIIFINKKRNNFIVLIHNKLCFVCNGFLTKFKL
jgi:hypothetical protein